MGVGLLVLSVAFGFLGFLLDGNLLNGEVLLFTYVFFFSPVIFVIGKIYDKILGQSGKSNDENKTEVM